MIDVISRDIIEAAAPDLTQAEVDQLHREVNAVVRRVAPCLATADIASDEVAEAEGIVRRALSRLDIDAWAESVTTGKYSVKYRPDAGTTSLFTEGDEAALRRLCGTRPASGTPEGSFPTAGSYDRLFGRPRY